MIRKRSLFTLLTTCMFSTLSAQDPTFSQFYANRLYLNPAWAGIEDGRRLFFNYRNQNDNTFVTYSASYDQYIEPLHGGIGFSIMNDTQGEGSLNQLSLSGIYSYHIKVNRSLSVNGGLQASWLQRKFNASDFIFGDQIDPQTGNIISGSESYPDSKKDFPDFSAGIAAFYKNYYAGFAAFHLFEPFQSVSSNPDARLPRKYLYYMGGFFPLYERRFGREVIQLNPNLIYLQQKNINQLCYGMEVLVQNLYAAGFLIRQNLGIKYSAAIFSAGLTVNNMRFRYSYDAQLPLPAMNLTPHGAHEISLIVNIETKTKINRKAIKCPEF